MHIWLLHMGREERSYHSQTGRNSRNAPVPLGKMAHMYKVACHMKQSRPCHPASGCAELAFFCGFLRSRSNGWWQFVPCGAEYGNLVGRNVEEFSGSHLAWSNPSCFWRWSDGSALSLPACPRHGGCGLVGDRGVRKMVRPKVRLLAGWVRPCNLIGP
jgi:hypothetical protein